MRPVGECSSSALAPYRDHVDVASIHRNEYMVMIILMSCKLYEDRKYWIGVLFTAFPCPSKGAASSRITLGLSKITAFELRRSSAT